MADDSKNAVGSTEQLQTGIQKSISPSEQIKLAKVLLHHYDTFHTVLQYQMERYTVACCNISLGGTAKFDQSSKMVIYDIKTEKKYRRESKDKFVAIKKSKISSKVYATEKKIIKLNLEEWTKTLLWGQATTVKVLVDGTEL